MSARRIGFATSAKYRELAPSDLLTAAHLRLRGFEVEPLVWTEVAPAEVICDIVVIRSVWDYHLHPERFLDWVSAIAERTVVFNHPNTVRWNSDKRYIFDLQQAALTVPSTVLLDRGNKIDLPAALREHGWSKAVLKPTISASAFETYLIDDGNATTLQPRINELLQSRAVLIQEFVPEIATAGEWSLMFFGGEYSHAVRKLPRSGDFRVQAEHGGNHQPAEPGAAVCAIARRVVDQFAASTLYARIDIVESKLQPVIMEVELIDPELFISSAPQSAERFADALQRI
jgi:glutathione synthase/RimK-type ligase-like ATP-grasp enzyme